MSIVVPYDSGFDPPAPVLPVGIAAPGSSRFVLLPMLVDSGADVSVLPASLTATLRLPMVDRILISGVASAPLRAAVYAASLRIGDTSVLARVVGLPGEAILGRDLLRRFVTSLDGPRGRLRMGVPRARARRVTSPSAR